jgi:hypothetical protein
MAKVVEHLPSQHEALSSNASTTKKDYQKQGSRITWWPYEGQIVGSYLQSSGNSRSRWVQRTFLSSKFPDDTSQERRSHYKIHTIIWQVCVNSPPVEFCLIWFLYIPYHPHFFSDILWAYLQMGILLYIPGPNMATIQNTSLTHSMFSLPAFTSGSPIVWLR